MGVGAQAPGYKNSEPGLGATVRQGPGHGYDTDVVEHGLAAVGNAAREVDLELARQSLSVRVVEEVAEGRLRPRRDVQDLEGAGAGQVAAGDVTHGVTASFTGRHADRARSRRSAGTRSSSTKWNWMFCRVVKCPQPRL